MYTTGDTVHPVMSCARYAPVWSALTVAANVLAVIALHAAERKKGFTALSGVMMALLIILLYLRTLVPVMDLSLYTVISFLPAIVLIETNYKFAWMFFLGSVLISLILPVNKLALLPFYSFFGYYGIIKYHFEKFKFKIIGFILKLIVFYGAIVLNFYFARIFLPDYISESISLILLLIVATPFLFIYDYLYTLAIILYENKIRKRIRRG